MVGRWPSALVLLFAVLVPAWDAPVRAQSETGATIKGTVVDDSTGAPLPNTHVFMSGSMTGTTVGKNGRFRLTGISQGVKDLYVTRLGYKPRRLHLVLHPDTTLSLSFRLQRTVIEGEEITVSAERGREWYERLNRFKKLFVGSSKRAKRCYLLNPEVLQFDTAWWGKFDAAARRPLQFENRALGYRVTYYLKEFEVRGDIVRWDGDPVFEPLTPRDSVEARRWKENRRRAFKGSLRHFLLALLNDRLDEEQFQMYRIPRSRAFRRVGRADRVPVDRDQILDKQPNGFYEMSFSGALEVVYAGEPESELFLDWKNARRSPRDLQVSQIRLNKRPIHIDEHGEIVEPYGATLYEYFAFTRHMSSLLPLEYRPPGTTLTASSPAE
jgi:hypothetical protein